eukprot:15341812-Ditylum_brightwellii.AAC.1
MTITLLMPGRDSCKDTPIAVAAYLKQYCCVATCTTLQQMFSILATFQRVEFLKQCKATVGEKFTAEFVCIKVTAGVGDEEGDKKTQLELIKQYWQRGQLVP